MLHDTREMREKGRLCLRVYLPCIAEFLFCVPFFSARETDIHNDKYREHKKREKCWPLKQESEHNKNEGCVLRMADFGVWTGNGKLTLLLRGIQNLPCICEEKKSIADKNVTHDMKRSEMRVASPAEQVFKKVSGIMRQEVNTRELIGKPAGKQINGEWKPIHFGKERDHKRRKRAERTPVARRLRLGKAPREDNENKRVEDDERPEAVSVFHRSMLMTTATVLASIFYFRLLSTGRICFRRSWPACVLPVGRRGR